MRVRLYCLGERWRGQVVRLDEFPAHLVQDETGQLRLAADEALRPLCVFDDHHGNLVLVRHDEQTLACLNADPIERGGIAPGDVLTLGEQRFLVSYERMTSYPLPSRTFQIAAAIPS